MLDNHLNHALFSSAADLLRRGEFICQYAYPREYNYLKDQEHLDAANALFSPFGELIVSTEGDDAFFLTYLDPTSDRAQKGIHEVIRSFHDSVEQHVLLFLGDLHRIFQDDNSFSPGFSFLYSELLSKIQASEAHKNSLAELSARVRTSKTEEPGQLDAVLKKILDSGYIIIQDATEMRYQVTGKVTYIYQLIDLLAPYTHPPEDEEQNAEQDADNDAQNLLFGGS